MRLHRTEFRVYNRFALCVCGYVIRKKERVIPLSSFLSSLSSLLYTLVIYNAEKGKKMRVKSRRNNFLICLCDLRIKHIVYIILRYSL